MLQFVQLEMYQKITKNESQQEVFGEPDPSITTPQNLTVS